MTQWFSRSCAFIIAVAMALVLATPALSEPLPREPLDAMWKLYMLEGHPQVVGISLRGSHVKKERFEGIRSAYPPTGDPESADTEPYGISVAQDGEGLFGNGGWWLHGGLLGRSIDGRLTIDLYGKVIEHIPPHLWRPWWMSEPRKRGGYEFFLLSRREGLPGATVLREWIILPEEVILEEDSLTGRPKSQVQVSLRYDPATRIATIDITGLKKLFHEQVGLSAVIEISPSQ